MAPYTFMDNEFRNLISIYRKEFLDQNSEELDEHRIKNITCDICFSDLLIDYTNNMNVCTNCAIGYPYFDYRFRPRSRSMPYKRKWHLMTRVNKLGIELKWRELENLLSTFINLDHAYTKKFPNRNMINLNFVIKHILLLLGYDQAAEKIHVGGTKRTIANWEEKLNLVL